MNDSETTFLKKEDPETPSGYRGVSIRGWLATMLVGTACILETGNCLVDIMQGRHFEVDSTFMMLVASVLAHYFATKPQPPPGTQSITATATNTPPL